MELYKIILFCVVLALLPVVLRRLVQLIQKVARLILHALGYRRDPHTDPAGDLSEHTRCASCGYSLENLEIPRCPECGALRGFTVPLQELGLTEEQVRRGFLRRRQQREATTGAASSPDDPQADPDSAPDSPPQKSFGLDNVAAGPRTGRRTR